MLVFYFLKYYIYEDKKLKSVIDMVNFLLPEGYPKLPKKTKKKVMHLNYISDVSIDNFIRFYGILSHGVSGCFFFMTVNAPVKFSVKDR